MASDNEGYMEMQQMQQGEMLPDSRKRPLDGDQEHSVSKKSNQGLGDCVLLKQLVPSTMAGVILGKGGDTINKLQTETATNIKMSKSGDFYPGTLDRVCLISGPAGNVRLVHDMIWERIRERYEKSGEDMKVKLVVPNATVGMIIGKGGCYVKQIKDETGAYVQISQKAQETMLVERVVTVAGTKDQIHLAFEMVFKMIVEDPQSGSCPNVSYADYKGPIANANPTGSPFANSASAGGGLDLGFVGASGAGGSGRSVNPHSVDMLKSTLRSSGYSIQASDEITAAMCTLNSYGLLGFGGAGLGSLGAMPSNVGGLSLDHLSTILTGGNRNPREMAPVGPGPMFGQFPSGPQTPDKSAASFDAGNFGNPRPTPNIGASDAPLAFNPGFPGFGASTNNNSFGLGTGMGTFQAPGSSSGASHDQSSSTKELQVAENIVGAVIGPGGRAIVEIQKLTSATLQISKKGVFAPGTRNRVVTISGSSSAVERAVFMVQQCIQQEESKRSRQEQMLK